MKTTADVFKEVLDELGFSGYKPSDMTNSDYWLCTCTAMERFASQSKWISVKERKPKETDYYPEGQLGDVLVKLTDNTVIMARYIFNDRFKIYWDNGLANEAEKRPVEYWKELQ